MITFNGRAHLHAGRAQFLDVSVQLLPTSRVAQVRRRGRAAQRHKQVPARADDGHDLEKVARVVLGCVTVFPV